MISVAEPKIERVEHIGNLTPSFRSLRDGVNWAVHIPKDVLDDSLSPHLEELPDQKKQLAVPFLAKTGMRYIPFGVTEIIDLAKGQCDGPAHKDTRTVSKLNIHFELRGRVAVQMALLPDDCYSQTFYQDMIRPITDYRNEGYEVAETELEEGDTLCFRGGYIGHQFTSLTADRASAIRSFSPHI
jgi:hypothetical protein